MNKLLLSFTLLSFSIFNQSAKAQTVSNFETYLLTDTFSNGSTSPLGYQYQDGNMSLNNYFDTAFGGYWSAGFAISGVKDSVTTGFGNLYGSITGAGEGGSDIYAVGNNFAIAKTTGAAQGKLIYGLHITNTTFAARSMENGDSFAKKFGGPDGNDPDWFKVQIIGFKSGSITDSINHYLADFRFNDNTQDYIVKDWNRVDLHSLGNVDSIMFVLTSSDANNFGINTPAFFAIDNIQTADSGLNLNEGKELMLNIFPNPSTDYIQLSNLNSKDQFEIISMTGQLVLKGRIESGKIDVKTLSKGQYFIKVISSKGLKSSLFVVE